MNLIIDNIVYKYLKLINYKTSKAFLKNVFNEVAFYDTLFQIKDGFNSLGIPNSTLAL